MVTPLSVTVSPTQTAFTILPLIVSPLSGRISPSPSASSIVIDTTVIAVGRSGGAPGSKFPAIRLIGVDRHGVPFFAVCWPAWDE